MPLVHLKTSAPPVDLKIGDLAKATGKTQRALRLYEELGLLVPGTRTAGGFRVYGVESIERVNWIGKLQDLGFTLHEIQDLLVEGPIPREVMARVREAFERKQAEVAQQIERLQELSTELATSLEYLETCVSDCKDSQCSSCHTHKDHAPALVEGIRS